MTRIKILPQGSTLSGTIVYADTGAQVSLFSDAAQATALAQPVTVSGPTDIWFTPTKDGRAVTLAFTNNAGTSAINVTRPFISADLVHFEPSTTSVGLNVPSIASSAAGVENLTSYSGGRFATTAPANIPVLTGTFTPQATSVIVELGVQAAIGGMAEAVMNLSVGPVTQNRRPRAFYQGEVRSWAQDIGMGSVPPVADNVITTGHLFGSFSANATRRTKISNLTPGVQYNYDLCMAIVGGADYPGPANSGGSVTGCTDIAYARSAEITYPPVSAADAISHSERGAWVTASVCSDGVRLTRHPGLGLNFPSYVWKTITTATLGAAAPVAVTTTPDGTKFVVVGANGASSKITTINVKDGSVATGPFTLPFAPRSVQCATNNVAWVTLDTAPGVYLQGYTLAAGTAVGGGISVTASATTTIPGHFRIPPVNPVFACVAAGSTVKVYAPIGDASTPALVYTITHSETVHVCDVSYDSTKCWVAGPSGLIAEYALANTSTPLRTLQITDVANRTTPVARNWVKMLRFPGTSDTHILLASSSTASPGYQVYQVDVANTPAGLQQYTQWPGLGSDNTNNQALSGMAISDDGGIFLTCPGKNTINYYFGSVFDLDPTYFLVPDYLDLSFTPATT